MEFLYEAIVMGFLTRGNRFCCLGFFGHETASAKFGAVGGGLLASSHGDVGAYGFVGGVGAGGYATLVLADTPCKP